MTELMNLDEDLRRFRTLHSWYKYNHSETILPFLKFGQQPYQPISPDTNPAYDTQLRWSFLIKTTMEEFIEIFPNDGAVLYDLSKKYASEIEIGNLGSNDDDEIIEQLTTNAKQFYDATKEIYAVIKSQKDKLCPKCSMPYLKSLGCFGSSCNRFTTLIYNFKSSIIISKTKEVKCDNKEDAELLDFVTMKLKMYLIKIGVFNVKLESDPLQLQIFYISNVWYAKVEYKDVGPCILLSSPKKRKL